jgi:hypothetical protein
LGLREVADLMRVQLDDVRTDHHRKERSGY